MDSNEQQRLNKLYNDYKSGTVYLDSVSDQDLPKLYRSSAHMARMEQTPIIIAETIKEEIVYRRSKADILSRERSSKASEQLTKALIALGIMQTVIFAVQLVVSIYK